MQVNFLAKRKASQWHTSMAAAFSSCTLQTSKRETPSPSWCPAPPSLNWPTLTDFCPRSPCMTWRTSRAGSTFRNTCLLLPERTRQKPEGSQWGWAWDTLNHRVTNYMGVLQNAKSYAPPGTWGGSLWFAACKETRGDPSKHQENYCAASLVEEWVEALTRHPFASLVWNNLHFNLLAALASPWGRSLS